MQGVQAVLPVPHSVSVKSLFIFAIFDETLKSMVLSPTSTIKPPFMSGFTCILINMLIDVRAIHVTDLGYDLKLLALTVFRLRDGSLQSLESLCIEFLEPR